jgi:ABC-type nitrate/sulfonate/bicarbonate transport system permease component
VIQLLRQCNGSLSHVLGQPNKVTQRIVGHTEFVRDILEPFLQFLFVWTGEDTVVITPAAQAEMESGLRMGGYFSTAVISVIKVETCGSGLTNLGFLPRKRS